MNESEIVWWDEVDYDYELDWFDRPLSELDRPLSELEVQNVIRDMAATMESEGVPSQPFERLTSDLALAREQGKVQDWANLANLFMNEGRWGEVIHRGVVQREVHVVAASAPSSDDAAVSASFSFAESRGGGLKLTLGVVSAGAKAQVTATRGIGIHCEAGEAKTGFLRLPVERVVQLWVPPGGHEPLRRTRFFPVSKELFRIGTGADATAEKALLRQSERSSARLGGTASSNGSKQHSTELQLDVTFGPKWGEDGANSLGIEASIRGSVVVDYSYELPAGSFDLYWLKTLAGGCLTDGNR